MLNTMPMETLDKRLFFRLYQCSNLMHKSASKAVETFGITSQQLAIMGALRRHEKPEGMTVGELCEHLTVSRQNLTNVLNRLDENGITQRVKDPQDGRIKRVGLTPHGEAMWNDLQPNIKGYYEGALDGIDEQQLQQFYELLNQLRNNLQRP